jgi:D-serine deaminase-like pyridoxal phosphate-dependent protein
LRNAFQIAIRTTFPALRIAGYQEHAFRNARPRRRCAKPNATDSNSFSISWIERFRWEGRILSMSEEHMVVEAGDLRIGGRLYLTPQHVCTTAYLYDKALVMTSSGQWDYRAQRGCVR